MNLIKLLILSTVFLAGHSFAVFKNKTAEEVVSQCLSPPSSPDEYLLLAGLIALDGRFPLCVEHKELINLIDHNRPYQTIPILLEYFPDVNNRISSESLDLVIRKTISNITGISPDSIPDSDVSYYTRLVSSVTDSNNKRKIEAINSILFDYIEKKKESDGLKYKISLSSCFYKDLFLLSSEIDDSFVPPEISSVEVNYLPNCSLISDDNTKLLSGFYQTFESRIPEPNGFDYWLGVLNSHGEDSLKSGFIGYFARIYNTSEGDGLSWLRENNVDAFIMKIYRNFTGSSSVPRGYLLDARLRIENNANVVDGVFSDSITNILTAKIYEMFSLIHLVIFSQTVGTVEQKKKAIGGTKFTACEVSIAKNSISARNALSGLNVPDYQRWYSLINGNDDSLLNALKDMENYLVVTTQGAYANDTLDGHLDVTADQYAVFLSRELSGRTIDQDTAYHNSLVIARNYKLWPCEINPSPPIFNSDQDTLVNITTNSNGIKLWSDGTAAASCKEYKNPPSGHSYSGSTGDGMYLITVNGQSFQAYCDMVTDGGGWTLIAKGQTISGDTSDFTSGSVLLPDYDQIMLIDDKSSGSWALSDLAVGKPNFWKLVGVPTPILLMKIGSKIYAPNIEPIYSKLFLNLPYDPNVYVSFDNANISYVKDLSLYPCLYEGLDPATGEYTTDYTNMDTCSNKVVYDVSRIDKGDRSIHFYTFESSNLGLSSYGGDNILQWENLNLFIR